MMVSPCAPSKAAQPGTAAAANNPDVARNCLREMLTDAEDAEGRGPVLRPIWEASFIALGIWTPRRLNSIRKSWEAWETSQGDQSAGLPLFAATVVIKPVLPRLTSHCHQLILVHQIMNLKLVGTFHSLGSLCIIATMATLL